MKIYTTSVLLSAFAALPLFVLGQHNNLRAALQGAVEETDTTRMLQEIPPPDPADADFDELVQLEGEDPEDEYPDLFQEIPPPDPADADFDELVQLEGEDPEDEYPDLLQEIPPPDPADADFEGEDPYLHNDKDEDPDLHNDGEPVTHRLATMHSHSSVTTERALASDIKNCYYKITLFSMKVVEVSDGWGNFEEELYGNLFVQTDGDPIYLWKRSSRNPWGIAEGENLRIFEKWTHSNYCGKVRVGGHIWEEDRRRGRRRLKDDNYGYISKDVTNGRGTDGRENMHIDWHHDGSHIRVYWRVTYKENRVIDGVTRYPDKKGNGDCSLIATWSHERSQCCKHYDPSNGSPCVRRKIGVSSVGGRGSVCMTKLAAEHQSYKGEYESC